MTRSSHIAKLNFDPEIERTFHILRRTATTEQVFDTVAGENNFFINLKILRK